jgi:hypothetical protein
MKLYFNILLFVVVNFMCLNFLFPYLFSASSDISVIIGLTILTVVYLPVNFFWGKCLIKMLKI